MNNVLAILPLLAANAISVTPILTTGCGVYGDRNPS
jgi:hypothetical protein